MNKQSIDIEALETLGKKLISSDVTYEQTIGQEILDAIYITEESTEEESPRKIRLNPSTLNE